MPAQILTPLANRTCLDTSELALMFRDEDLLLALFASSNQLTLQHIHMALHDCASMSQTLEMPRILQILAGNVTYLLSS